MNIFPFNKVEKNSKIIIYGMRTVGQGYYSQVKAIDYCDIVGVFVQKADKVVFDYKFCKEFLFDDKELMKIQCDYYVIAAPTENFAKPMEAHLTKDLGIPKEKIVNSVGEKYSMAKALFDLDDMLSGRDNLSYCLDMFLQHGQGDMLFFKDIKEELQNRFFPDKKLEKEYLDYFLDFVRNEPQAEKRIVMLRLLFEVDLFNKDCSGFLLDAVDSLEDTDSKIWMLWEISNMESKCQRFAGDDFFIKERKIMKDCMDEYMEGVSFDKGEPSKDGKRLAFIAADCYYPSHIYFKYLIPKAKKMMEWGYEIKVFTIDLLRYRYGECFIEPSNPVIENTARNEKDLKEALGGNAELARAEGYSIRDRVQCFAKELFEYNPDLVYDFSGNYPFCSSIYYNAFPTVAMPMRGFSTAAFCHKYISRDKEICIVENMRTKSLALDQIDEVKHDITSLVIVPSESYNRADYGFCDDDFLIFTTGRRLGTDMSREFIDVVTSFLKENRKSRWLLVGNDIGDYVKKQYKDMFDNRQIINWGFEKNLQRLALMCDVLWNPNRNGNMGAMEIAMRQGIPIITTDQPSELTAILGKDIVVHGDYNDCKKKTKKLMTDRDFMIEEKNKMVGLLTYDMRKYDEYIQKIISVGYSIKTSKP